MRAILNGTDEIMPQQQTLARRISCSGQALHLGREIGMTLSPAPPDSGIVFCRVDLPGRPSIRASVDAVVDTRRCVTLGRDGWRVGTIEHLLAAAHGLGIDNLRVEVEGEELPVGDGSARYFARLMQEAGLSPQPVARIVRRIEAPAWVAENGGYLVALPSPEPGLTVSFTFSADERAIGAQYRRFHLGIDDFTGEIAPARTVAFLEELEALRREGLAQSTDPDVVVVVGPDGYVNSLRFPDELVRHKILDLLGDLFLLGHLQGLVIGVRSGHRLNHLLGRELALRGALAVPPGSMCD